MKRYLALFVASVVLASCTTIKPKTPTPTPSSTKHNIVGLNWKHSDPKLKEGLIRLSKRYGRVVVTSSCRTHKSNRGAKNSYHLYSRGCKAADIYIPGVKLSTIARWWRANIGGGIGTYRCRNFIHVDVGPSRSWHWNTKCKRRR